MKVKLEDIVKRNFSLGDPLAEYLIKGVLRWAKELVPKKQNEDVPVIDRETDAANYATCFGHNNCRKEMLKNIKEG